MKETLDGFELVILKGYFNRDPTTREDVESCNCTYCKNTRSLRDKGLVEIDKSNSMVQLTEKGKAVAFSYIVSAEEKEQ